MKKYILYSLISIGCIVNNHYCITNNAQDNFIDSFFKEMQEFDKDWDEFIERRSQRIQKLQESFKNDKINQNKLKDITRINIQEVGNNIEIVLPVADSNIKTGDIQLKAKGKNLEGSFSYNDHKVNFIIKNGWWFTSWVSYKEEKKSEKEEDKQYLISSSFSSQTIRLPKEVSNLEDANAYYVKEEVKKNNKVEQVLKLKIVLPKTETKSDWKKIEVKNAFQQPQIQNIK